MKYIIIHLTSAPCKNEKSFTGFGINPRTFRIFLSLVQTTYLGQVQKVLFGIHIAS